MLEQAVAALAKSDRRLGALMERVGPCLMVPPKTFSPFQALASSIAHQQLNGRAAATILERYKQRVGAGKWPTAEQVAVVHVRTLRAAGFSGGKVRALKDLAAKALDGTVPRAAVLRKLSDDEIVERLTTVRGIGRWTVEMMLMFRLGRLDVLPVDDFGVRAGFARWFRKGVPVKPRELMEYGERWRPYRSVASWYMWRATELPKTA